MEFSNQQVEMSIEHLRDDDASTGGDVEGTPSRVMNSHQQEWSHFDSTNTKAIKLLDRAQ